MATIHLARLLGPKGFSRTVAIKQLHPQFAQNPQFVAMLLDEARLAVRVRHGNVVSPLDIVATDSELFIVMDYVHGESFANLLVAAGGPLPPPFAAAVMVQALLGLHAAHEATREQGDALGLVHRDVSPQNIQVGHDGVARMVDFGIAKAVARTQTTDGGMVKGKLGYMAPEQIRLEVIDRRTDVFSAGVVLWEALTGRGLFVADALGASVEQILHGEIAPPSCYNPAVSPELDAVVSRALDRNRDTRFQDAMSMAVALQRATPVASALEVIGWVESLAGPELSRRAELVKRAEASSWEPAQVSPHDAAESAELPPMLARKRWAETVAVSARSLRRTPTLLGLATPAGEAGGGQDASGAPFVEGSEDDSDLARSLLASREVLAAGASAPRAPAGRDAGDGRARRAAATTGLGGLLGSNEPLAPAGNASARSASAGSASVGSASVGNAWPGNVPARNALPGYAPAGHAPTDNALTATGVSTGIAVGGDRVLPEVGGKRRWGWRSRGIAFGFALAGVSAAVGVLALSGPRSSLGSGAAEPVVEPARALEASSDPLKPSVSGPVVQTASSAPLVRPIVSDATGGVTSWADDEAGEAGELEAVQPTAARARGERSVRRGRARSAASARRAAKASASADRAPAIGGSVNEAKSNGRAAASSAGASPRASGCNPPWVVNEQQVKVFKAECLR